MGWFPTELLIFIAIVATGVALIILLQQRRSPQSAVAWILFILAVPYLGVLAYFALGVRKRTSGYARIGFDSEVDPAPVLDPMDANLRALGVPAAQAGHALTFETSAEQARAAVGAIVETARDQIDVTLYRLDADEAGRWFVGLLTEAAGRGVRVRMILDGFGTWRRPRGLLRDFRAAGGELLVFAPMVQRLATVRMNLRNHRKMIIADGATVWAGGRNVGLTYLGESGDRRTWEDMSFTLRGPSVRRFGEVFEADWHKISGEARPVVPPAVAPGGTANVQLVASGPDLDHDAFHDALVHAIHTARDRIWIATPYFLPTDHLHHALATVARLGRDVRILVPDTSNQKLADIARGAYLRELDEAGCRILRYPDRMMHAKVMVIDNTAWIGSANFDVRSMYLNFETSLMIYDPEHSAELARWFGALEADCRVGVARARLPRRLVEATFRLGAPIL